MPSQYEAISIGVSAGGFRALGVLLRGLPASFEAPIIVVQHRMASPDNYFISYLDRNCLLKVKEAEEKEKIVPHTVYIAPADYHLLVEKDRTFSLSVDGLVCFARPAIDVLFESAADAYGEHLIGVILTGANSDGSNGLRYIKTHGGLTISQDPQTAESNFMPLSAIATGAVDFILPLQEIPNFLTNLLEESDDSSK